MRTIERVIEIHYFPGFLGRADYFEGFHQLFLKEWASLPESLLRKDLKCDFSIFMNSICDNESLFDFENWPEWAEAYLESVNDFAFHDEKPLRI